MKMPFYTILGPLLRKNQKEIGKLCTTPFLRIAPVYVGVLGTLGVVSTLKIIKLSNVLILFIGSIIYFLIHFILYSALNLIYFP